MPRRLLARAGAGQSGPVRRRSRPRPPARLRRAATLVNENEISHPVTAALKTDGPVEQAVAFDTLGGITIAMTGTGDGRSHFRMVESFYEDGALCLSLIGELDLAVADDLATRLHQLHEQRLDVRRDLSQWEFTDSTGIRELSAPLIVRAAMARG